MKYKEFKPNWRTSVENKNSFRNLFRWGNPKYMEEPTEGFYQYIKENLGLSDEDFILSSNEGEDEIDINVPCKLKKEHVDEFIDIVGQVNVATDTLTRLKACYNKGVLDSMRLRRHIVENLPDVVLMPSSEEQVRMILKYCVKNNIPIYPLGGATNMTYANECLKGGVKLNFKRNFNKVISFNEIDQTVTVMPGITGPQLEDILNNANEYFTNVTGRYTLGHIPESFEFSTVGGWIATRAVGQASLKYGSIDDMVLSATYLTPKGDIFTYNCNRDCGMPSFDELFMGTDGQLGLIVSVTLKVRRYTYDSKKFFSYIFKDWDTACRCVKDLLQREIGLPSVLRLCDSDSTEQYIRMSKLIGRGPFATIMERLGNVEGSRCMMLGYTEGEKSYSSYVKRNLYRHALRYGAYTATGKLAKKWERTRFNNAYTRDILQDYDIILDKIICNVTWSSLQEIYPIVKDFFNDKDVLNMIHLTDMTPHGCLMNIIYVSKYASVDEFEKFYNEVIDMLVLAGALAPRSNSIGNNSNHLLSSVSESYITLLKAVKKHLDPKNILNPSGYISTFRQDKNEK